MKMYKRIIGLNLFMMALSSIGFADGSQGTNCFRQSICKVESETNGDIYLDGKADSTSKKDRVVMSSVLQPDGTKDVNTTIYISEGQYSDDMNLDISHLSCLGKKCGQESDEDAMGIPDNITDGLLTLRYEGGLFSVNVVYLTVRWTKDNILEAVQLVRKVTDLKSGRSRVEIFNQADLKDMDLSATTNLKPLDIYKFQRYQR